MYSIGFKSRLQAGIFMRLNISVRSKLTSNSCNIEYLVGFKLKYETLKYKNIWVWVLHFRIFF